MPKILNYQVEFHSSRLLRLSVLALCSVLAAIAQAGDGRTDGLTGFVKGYSWGWTGRRGEYAAPEAAQSMKNLASTGADCVCIAFATYMRTAETPEFRWSEANPSMVSDDEIRQAIALARENHMRVIVKPVVNCRDETWRAWIRFFRPITAQERTAGVTGELDPWRDEPKFREGETTDESKWDAWWRCYTDFLLHYARIAQEEKAEAFCLGCEMNSTEEQVQRWRALIAKVREVYKGSITYDVNHGREQQLAWWDAVDFISISAYYAVPAKEGIFLEDAAAQTTTTAEIVAHLETVKQRLAALHRQTQKPILFIETGCTSVRGCARYPWSHPDPASGHPVDQDEQANYYQAMLQVFWEEPWFMGFAWWDWPARLYDAEHASRSRAFCVYGKKAEQVLRTWYAKPRADIPPSGAEQP